MTKWTTENALNYIKSRVAVSPTDCWEWTGPRTKDGYGQFGSTKAIRASGQKLVHRAMFAITNDFTFTSRDQQVMHQCHNRSCCNPAHLERGTAAENMRAARERGSRFGKMGDEHGSCKISSDQVREIRQLRATGMSYKEIASFYPIKPSHVGDICRRQKWKHVQ